MKFHDLLPIDYLPLIYFINLNIRLKRGPLSQLNQINEALPTTLVSGTKPQ